MTSVVRGMDKAMEGMNLERVRTIMLCIVWSTLMPALFP
jgi:division protein CdvB (Snf7/Vps24/ESCRT-III family)